MVVVVKEILTLKLRKTMFGMYTLGLFYMSFMSLNLVETYTISIFDIYEFDVGRFMYSCCIAINVFCFKMFVLAFILPDSHVQHSVLLKKIH